ncbi:MAG: cation:proton antiporter [Lentisphaeraceae bacterium]|nr:cation:proton antiporter [Lentisphaeraceae bacterium]
MDPQLLSISTNDPLWIAIAFVCGFLVKLIKLPPLIGFLAAGFLLNILGAESGSFLNTTADLGITLLLFTIGLKLKLKELAKPQVWGVATMHMGVVTVMIAIFTLLLAQTRLPLFSNLDFKTCLLIGFALSFSSTVFAIKILDELGASNSQHGKISVGVLVVQDIAAVIFLSVSIGKVPTIWALALLLLIPLRPLILKLLEKAGHGELLVLFGVVVALGGADLFEIVGIKADAGALVFGMLLANHQKSNELAKALLSLKDLFLVGFFLSIGMTALPGWAEMMAAMFFLVLLPLKVAVYFGAFNLFYLRASTSWRSSLNLANYSEFGLIVGALAYSAGWLGKEWLAVFAIVVSLSFIISAPLVNIRDSLYQNWRGKLKAFERKKRLPGDEDIDLSHIKVVIFGMGRMGTAVYDEFSSQFKNSIIGVEVSPDKALKHQEAGKNVFPGDATNPDFWTKVPGLIEGLEWVLLTLPTHKANMTTVIRLRELGFEGKIAATSKYKDEEEALKEIGIDYTFNIYKEAGVGFANELKSKINNSIF